MTATSIPHALDDILQDDLALSLARAMTAANKSAQEAGIDTGQSCISIKQHQSEQGLIWRIFYGHFDPVGRRGGGLTVDVDLQDATVKRVLRGQ